jgi:hypothetical protein
MFANKQFGNSCLVWLALGTEHGGDAVDIAEHLRRKKPSPQATSVTIESAVTNFPTQISDFCLEYQAIHR